MFEAMSNRDYYYVRNCMQVQDFLNEVSFCLAYKHWVPYSSLTTNLKYTSTIKSIFLGLFIATGWIAISCVHSLGPVMGTGVVVPLYVQSVLCQSLRGPVLADSISIAGGIAV